MATRDDLSERQLAKQKKRVAGDRSAKVSRELMQAAESMLAKLEIDDDLRAAIANARGVKAMVARRRAERALAGALRRADLAGLQIQLASLRATGAVDSDRMRIAEQWRTRLLDDGLAAIGAFPGGDPEHVLPRLIAQAQRERTTGKPPGSARALFRHVVEALKAHDAAAAPEQDDGDDDDSDDSDEET